MQIPTLRAENLLASVNRGVWSTIAQYIKAAGIESGPSSALPARRMPPAKKEVLQYPLCIVR